MAQLFLNNLETVFIASVKATPSTGTPATELDYGILRISDAIAATIGTLTGGDYYVLTAFKRVGTVESNLEIMLVTAIDNSTPSECRITVSRAQEGTTAKAFAAADYLSLRMTAGGLTNYAQLSGNLAGLGSTATARTNLGLGNVDNTSDATKNAAVATLANKTLTSPILTTPALGTPTALVLTSATGLPLGGSGVTGVLTVPHGGMGVATLTSGGILVGNGTSAVGNATAAQIVAAISTTAVTNATNTVNSGVTNDVATAVAVYPVWKTAATGNLPEKVSSTKLTFNPSTGALSATSFTGAGTGLTGTAASLTVGAATNAVNTAVTDDVVETIAYPTWVDATTGNLAQKISSTKLSFNPSTGVLSSTSFSGPLTGNVTGNSSGTAATVTGATQAAITSVGTLTSLTSTGAITADGALMMARSGVPAQNITIKDDTASGGQIFGYSTSGNAKPLVYDSTTDAINTVPTSGTCFHQFNVLGASKAQITTTGLNSAAIGATTPSTGAFTTLSASTSISGPGTGLTGTAASLTAGNATNAVNATTATNASELVGGVAGAIPYQSGVGATSFSAAGTSGQVLTSTGTGAPAWVAQGSIAAGSATTATTATTATNSVNSGVTNDVATAVAVYPTWVTANTGNLPAKTSSTQLSFVPSTGILTATGFVGALTGSATQLGGVAAASYAKFGSAQTWASTQRTNETTDNDGSFDLSAALDFKCTPSGAFTLTFTSIPATPLVQKGTVILVNTGGYAVSAHANTKLGASTLATISAAGTYQLAYRTSNGLSYVTASGVLS